jgi:hypothetical protein
VSSGFDYPRLLRGAAEALVRRVVTQAAEDGLPGEHHFYLTFRTRRPGVELPASLLSRYPETMTVVLQHQYTGLEVDEEGFAVTLRFGGSWERIRVPFAALTAFLDPSVPFGLDLEQFEAAANLEPELEAAAESPRAQSIEPEEDAEELEGPAGSEAAPERGADVLPFRPR